MVDVHSGQRPYLVEEGARANPKSAILSTGSIEPVSTVHAGDIADRYCRKKYLHVAWVGSEQLTITK